MALGITDIDETQAPLIDHLIELRGRIVRCLIALAVGFSICLYFSEYLYGFLVRPLEAAFPQGHGRLIYTKLYEAFFVQLKVAMFGGFCLSFPVIANQLWAFVAPGLYAKEKRAFLPFLLATPLLFAAGASLAYYVVMPTAFRWFISFQGDVGGVKLEALPAAGEYLSFVMQIILAFGISFLSPVLLLLLNMAGIVSRAQLAGARRYIIVAIVSFAAVVTPPDPGSQIILSIPLYLLFEGALFIMKFTEKARENEGAEVISEGDSAQA